MEALFILALPILLLFSAALASKLAKSESSSEADRPVSAGSSPIAFTAAKSGAYPNTPTVDEEYADSHNMWVCPYCESLNSYPPGVPKKAKMPPSPEPERTPSALRGDLINRFNSAKSAVPEVKLYCIVCGKEF